jgi:methylphosphotriester-DNA--protein-cysteine methyltransferase
MPRLAKEAATSVATLERSFREIYASTPAHYQSLIRVRVTAGMLRNDEGSIEGVIISAGWRSLREFARSLQRMTGWRPAQLRHCSADEFDALISGPLRVPVPHWHRWSNVA